jgi:hypothetical protein
MKLSPCTIKQALPFIAKVHRRLPKIQGAMWAVSVIDDSDQVLGVAIVGHPARELSRRGVLYVSRVAVIDGAKNACSMLYGACSRAARAMGATDLVTYTHTDEPGTSLRAAGWVHAGLTSGGEYSRPSRCRAPVVDRKPKNRWLAPWGEIARSINA